MCASAEGEADLITSMPLPVSRIAVSRPRIIGALLGLLILGPTCVSAADAEATSFTRAAMTDAAARVAADDRQDFADADRGYLGTLADPVIRTASGDELYDLRSYDFLKGEAAATANPSLWRQAQILTRHGLYKLADGIWQVRGFDVSIVSIIDAGTGWLVVDPLTSVEAAKSAMQLVTEQLGAKPVIAVIYSHSHGDHYGGVLGVTSRADVSAGRTQIIAPDGFMEHAVAENIIAGPAMSRRARYQFGLALPRGPTGEMTSGLGPRIARGTMSLIAPTKIIRQTGETMAIGNLQVEFQVTPGTEAPAEMNFYLPGKRALFMAENANLTMHNLLPARGALVRDAKAWADYLTESLRRYAGRSDVLFAAHGIPRYSSERVSEFLRLHRDVYKYLHDQSVRLMNAGLTSREIAENLQLPEALASQWFNRGYYGTMSHNSKAVYQRYMGWYDANPANLNAHPPEAESVRYIAAMGGEEKVLTGARKAIAEGDYRWAATLLNHLVFSGGEQKAARTLLAKVYTQLGYQSEAGTWRNIYLTGAQELTQGVAPGPINSFSPDVLAATPTSMLLDFVAVRIDPARAPDQSVQVRVNLTDRQESHFLSLENGVLVHEQGVEDKAAVTLSMQRPTLLMTLFAGAPLEPLIARGDIEVEGDAGAFSTLLQALGPLDPGFNIVTP